MTKAPQPPVIIECAVNGQTDKAVNPATPRTPQEVAACAMLCVRSGASIIHSHIENVFADVAAAADEYADQFAPLAQEHPEILAYPTLCLGDTAQTRLGHVEALAERGLLGLALFEPGSVNVGGLSADGLPKPIDLAYVNTPADIRFMADQAQRLRLPVSASVFEPGWMRHFLAYWRAGAFPHGALLKIYFGGDYGYMGDGLPGLNFGLPPEPWALDVYLRMLGDCPVPWVVGVVGGDLLQGDLAAYALSRGGHLRVGLEDFAGDARPRNEDLVSAAAALAHLTGREVATPAQAHALMRGAA